MDFLNFTEKRGEENQKYRQLQPMDRESLYLIQTAIEMFSHCHLELLNFRAQKLQMHTTMSNEMMTPALNIELVLAK